LSCFALLLSRFTAANAPEYAQKPAHHPQLLAHPAKAPHNRVSSRDTARFADPTQQLLAHQGD
jgi:phosphopantothenoylcysteine synthetase/decarboxylase